MVNRGENKMSIGMFELPNGGSTSDLGTFIDDWEEQGCEEQHPDILAAKTVVEEDIIQGWELP